MELKDLSKSYGPLEVFENLDYRIERGDRIAVVGVNGAGKSTLSRILAGVESFNAGQRVVGHNVTLSYFAQHQAEELDPAREVLETMSRDRRRGNPEETAHHASGHSFSTLMMFSRRSQFSRGAKKAAWLLQRCC